MQNVIIKGKDNPARIEFTFTGDVTLASFASITVSLGGETYTSGSAELAIDGNALVLSIGDATALAPGSYYPEIVGFSAQFDDGYLLSGEKLRVLQNSLLIR
jgi:hypothetical protein